MLATRLTGHVDAIRDVAWSPDGVSLASVSQDKSVRVWSVTPGSDSGAILAPVAAFVATFAGHTDTVRCACVRAFVCMCMLLYV